MNYSYEKLKQRISEKYGTLSRFAEMSGLPKSNVSMKLRGETQWSQKDITLAIEALDIPAQEIPEYFFTPQTAREADSLTSPVFRRQKSIAELQGVAKEILRLFRMHWLTTGDALWTLVFLLVKMLFGDERAEQTDCHSADGASQ